jgi:uncharacterized protein YlxW (UPF0749 family)
MGPFEMVIGIVLITSVAGMWKAKYGIRHSRSGRDHGVDTVENQRLRDEVKQLKDRLAVLERITVEKENSLEREIEQLRDR